MTRRGGLRAPALALGLGLGLSLAALPGCGGPHLGGGYGRKNAEAFAGQITGGQPPRPMDGAEAYAVMQKFRGAPVEGQAAAASAPQLASSSSSSSSGGGGGSGVEVSPDMGGDGGGSKGRIHLEAK